MAEQNLSVAAQELLNLIRDGWIPVVAIGRSRDASVYTTHRQYYITHEVGRIISSDALRATEGGNGYYIQRESVQIELGISAKTPWGEVPQMGSGNSLDLDQNALWELVAAGLVEEKFYADESVAYTVDFTVFGLVEAAEPVTAETQASEAPAAPQVDELPNVVSGDFVLLDILPDTMQEKNERIAKLEADNAAYERIVIQAGKDFAALKDENARMKEAISAVLDMMIDNHYNAPVRNILIAGMNGQTILAPKEPYDPTPPAQEAPKRPVATRCRKDS